MILIPFAISVLNFLRYYPTLRLDIVNMFINRFLGALKVSAELRSPILPSSTYRPKYFASFTFRIIEIKYESMRPFCFYALHTRTPFFLS